MESRAFEDIDGQNDARFNHLNLLIDSPLQRRCNVLNYRDIVARYQSKFSYNLACNIFGDFVKIHNNNLMLHSSSC